MTGHAQGNNVVVAYIQRSRNQMKTHVGPNYKPQGHPFHWDKKKKKKKGGARATGQGGKSDCADLTELPGIGL